MKQFFLFIFALALIACSSTATAPNTPNIQKTVEFQVNATLATRDSTSTSISPTLSITSASTEIPTPVPTPTSVSTPTPEPTPAQTPRPFPTPTNTPLPTSTPVPTPTSTPLPTSTPKPTPTQIPTPTAIPYTTKVGEVIRENTTWKSDESPILVTGEIQIPCDVILTINPGTTVSFSPGAGFKIDGHLIARGTGDSMIKFIGTSQNTFAVGAGNRCNKDYTLAENDGFTRVGNYSHMSISHSSFNGFSALWGQHYGNISITNSTLIGGMKFNGDNNSLIFKYNVVFDNSSRLITVSGGSFQVQNNCFNMATSILYQSYARRDSPVQFNFNSILVDDTSNVTRLLSTSSVGGTQYDVNASSNYWGGFDSEQIGSMILDSDDDISLKAVVDISTPLTGPHADTPEC